jgi:hypothetical protein
MTRLYAAVRRLVWLAMAAVALFVGYAFLRDRPQDLPWTALDLADPPGVFTGRKLAALTKDAVKCRALLDKAGIAYTAMKPGGERECAYADAVRLKAGGKGEVTLAPADVAPSCPVAAALKLWEWHFVQPAAQRLLGQPIVRITHFGSYSCRRMYGRSAGDFSEHATADAIDISGFVLKDGRKISVVNDWKGDGPEATFLHSVRNGACRLFSTVLSPDYNAAHRDHFHLDQAERGAMGWRACR